MLNNDFIYDSVIVLVSSLIQVDIRIRVTNTQLGKTTLINVEKFEEELARIRDQVQVIETVQDLA